MKHLFACLVHDSRESVGDLVCNLALLEPDATILLYNGGGDPGLLDGCRAIAGRRPVVHPRPRRVRWGALHEFALDCMRFALDELPFDVLTIVDSDQLLLRRGYGARIAGVLRAHPRAGVLGSTSSPQPWTTTIAPAVSAWRERERWLPYLRRFPGGEAQFPHWTFWPATVFTAAACRDLVRAFEDPLLDATMRASAIFATEEIVLPTVAALHGHELRRNPCCTDYVRYAAQYTPSQLRAALEHEDAFWIHPIPRPYDDPLRRIVRARHGGYPGAGAAGAAPRDSGVERWEPVLERMRTIEGWLGDGEAGVLIAGLNDALEQCDGPHAIVEIGSYLGRGTSVLGGVVQALGADAKVYAIDPHDGRLGALDVGIRNVAPSLRGFERNMAAAGLGDVVTTVCAQADGVQWDRPVSFMLVDGLHDHASVSRDFRHFEPWLAAGACVAFHDYAGYFPGVVAFVDELLAGGRYVQVARADSMILLRPVAAAVPSPRIEPVPVAPIALAAAPARPPAISCIMPTFDRTELALAAVERFLRQDVAEAELVVIDDGAESLADLLPGDPRIVHLRLPGRLTIGAKRNLGCEAARADLLANWDDDDWYAPHRLRAQIAALADSGADVVGLDELLYLEPASGCAWHYRWPRGSVPWLHDATLAFTRAFWERNPFPDVSMGIDCGLLWTQSTKRLHAIADPRMYVGIIHAGNTSPKHTSTGLWSRHPAQELEELLGDDMLRGLGAREQAREA